MRWRSAGPPGPGLRRLTVTGLAVALCGSGLAHAQLANPAQLNAQGDGIAWGPATVRPTVTFNYGYDDNIFYASDDLSTDVPVGSREAQVQPGIRFDLPFGESYLQGGYSALYRNYATDEYTPTTQWSHYFDLRGRIRAGARGYFNLQDRFVRGTEELREVDPGGELTFGDLPFRSHTPSVEAGIEFGLRQGASVVWNYSSSQYSEVDGQTFSNYRGHGLQFRYNYRLRADASAYLYYGADTMEQQRAEGEIDYSGETVGLGYTQTLGRSISAQFSGGYQVLEATGGLQSTYHGPTASGSATWRIGDSTRFILGARRVPYQSFYLNNAYYLNRAFNLEMLRQVGSTGYWRLLTAFDQNTYNEELDITGLEIFYCRDDGSGLVCPSAGVRRRDTGWRAEAGFGAQLSRVARWYLGYNWESRSTNLLAADTEGFGDPFSYEINRFFFRIEVGWL